MLILFDPDCILHDYYFSIELLAKKFAAEFIDLLAVVNSAYVNYEERSYSERLNNGEAEQPNLF